MMITIRPERPADRTRVRQIHADAFGQPDEADLVERLRDETPGTRAWTAVVGDEIAGHVVYSPVTVEPPAPSRRVLGLAPMAVAPSRQREGIGSALVRDSLASLREDGLDGVVVLGHPEYYPRFGFVAASSFGLRCEYDVPDEVFMALALRDGALDAVSGLVRYAPPFAAVG